MLISECCGADLNLVDVQEGMSFYECKKCSRPAEGCSSIAVSVADTNGEKDHA